jgi:uncharacterized protein (TIGR02391 family)
MKINEAIKELWKKNFFNVHRSPKEVKIELFNQYGITCSNISMQLTSCKTFLRKENNGWIQKTKYSSEDKKIDSKKDSIKYLLDNNSLWSACESSFINKEYWDACLHAFRHLEIKIREKCGLTAADHGIDLVNKAFNPTNGLLKIPSCATRAEEEGFHSINRGIVLFHRNAKGHREGNIDRNNTIKIICYVDYILEILKTAQKRSNP